MSADWFCKIGEKKYGPLNGQQLKTIVAKGQLKPDHLVRHGSEGPWVPAGRIKGLFPHDASGNGASLGKKPPAATAEPLARAAKAGSLPTADAAPMPPSDVPQDLLLGAHKHHVELNVDSLNIEATPMKISHRKVRTGMQGLKQEERKRVTVLLLCFIGAGTDDRRGRDRLATGSIAILPLSKWRTLPSRRPPRDGSGRQRQVGERLC